MRKKRERCCSRPRWSFKVKLCARGNTDTMRSKRRGARGISHDGCKDNQTREGTKMPSRRPANAWRRVGVQDDDRGGGSGSVTSVRASGAHHVVTEEKLGRHGGG